MKAAPTNSRILQICFFELKVSYVARVGADLVSARPFFCGSTGEHKVRPYEFKDLANLLL